MTLPGLDYCQACTDTNHSSFVGIQIAGHAHRLRTHKGVARKKRRAPLRDCCADERNSIPIVQGKETSNNTAGSMTERLSIPYHFSRTARFSKSLIYDIGTEILNFRCFATQMLKSFCRSIIFSGLGTARRQQSF